MLHGRVPCRVPRGSGGADDKVASQALSPQGRSGAVCGRQGRTWPYCTGVPGKSASPRHPGRSRSVLRSGWGRADTAVASARSHAHRKSGRSRARCAPGMPRGASRPVRAPRRSRSSHSGLPGPAGHDSTAKRTSSIDARSPAIQRAARSLCLRLAQVIAVDRRARHPTNADTSTPPDLRLNVAPYYLSGGHGCGYLALTARIARSFCAHTRLATGVATTATAARAARCDRPCHARSKPGLQTGGELRKVSGCLQASCETYCAVLRVWL